MKLGIKENKGNETEEKDNTRKETVEKGKLVERNWGERTIQERMLRRKNNRGK